MNGHANIGTVALLEITRSGAATVKVKVHYSPNDVQKFEINAEADVQLIPVLFDPIAQGRLTNHGLAYSRRS